ncbi:MAG: hypothetical protein ABIH04_07530 [Planctomycetota bacterium]
MKTRAIGTVIAALLVALFATSAFAAEKITFPTVTKGKVVDDNWYHEFAEGRKIGYTHEKIVEVKCEGEECLLIEVDSTYKMKSAGKTLKSEDSISMIVSRDGWTPMYYERKMRAPGLKLSRDAKVEKKNAAWNLKVSITANGKTSFEERDLLSANALCFENCGLLMYRAKYLEEKIRAVIDIIDFDLLDLRTVEYSVIEKKTEGEGENARTFRLVDGLEGTIWYDSESRIDRITGRDGQYASILTDKKKVKDFTAEMEGYKAPDSIKGDAFFEKSLGIEIKRPDKCYFFAPNLENYSLEIIDYLRSSHIMVRTFYETPKGISLDDAFKRIKEYYSEMAGPVCLFGDGKVVDAGEQKCLRGDFAFRQGVDAYSGEYHIFVLDDRVVFILAVALADTYENLKKEMTACVDSISFKKPEFDESRFLFTDKHTGLRLKMPHAGWLVVPYDSKKGDGSVFFMRHLWQNALVLAQVRPGMPGMKIEAILGLLKRAPGVTKSGTMKVGKYDVAWAEAETARGGKKMKMKSVAIIKGEELIFLTMMVDKENWEKTGQDFDAIMKSLDFIEKVRVID